jgi:hypothetical protein
VSCHPFFELDRCRSSRKREREYPCLVARNGGAAVHARERAYVSEMEVSQFTREGERVSVFCHPKWRCRSSRERERVSVSCHTKWRCRSSRKREYPCLVTRKMEVSQFTRCSCLLLTGDLNLCILVPPRDPVLTFPFSASSSVL